MSFREQHDAALGAAAKAQEQLLALTQAVAAQIPESPARNIEKVKKLIALIDKANEIYGSLVNL